MFSSSLSQKLPGTQYRESRPSALSDLRADIQRTYDMLSGGRISRFLGCMRSPGVHAVTAFRFGQWSARRARAFRLALDPIYFVLNFLVQVLWGIELPRSASVGPGLYIGHFGGITISGKAIIGKNCNLSQNITIGISGHGDKAGVPIIGNDVYIAPGARLFGKIHVGNNAKIGANAVVYRDVPANAVVALDPGFRIISMKGNRPARAAQLAA
jgi:serine O-acetyltransferase